MDSTTLQSVNAYLQSLTPTTQNIQLTQQPTVSTVSSQNLMNQQLLNQFYPTTNTSTVANYHQLLNLLIQQPAQTSTNHLSFSNGVYGNMLDPNLITLLNQQQLQNNANNFQQQQQFNAQLIAMELNRQTHQQSNMSSNMNIPQQLQQTSQKQQQLIVNGQTPVIIQQNNANPMINVRKRRHREDSGIQSKQSFSHNTSPVNVSDNVNVRNRSLTCPESIQRTEQQSSEKNNEQTSSSSTTTTITTETATSNDNKKEEEEKPKNNSETKIKEFDPLSPYRHHPDNLPALDHNVQLMEQLALFYMMNSVKSSKEEEERRLAGDSYENSDAKKSQQNGDDKPIPAIPLADVHRLLEDVLNTTNV